MLTDPEEIRIISNAIQKNVQDPKRSREHFLRIFFDFLEDKDFKDKIFLDLGPGQYDFGVLASQRGALVYGIDSDPAVIELGRYKGFPVTYGNLENIRADECDTDLDGVFCKYSIDAFWFAIDHRSLEKHILEIIKLIRRGGWAWIAPWNGAYEETGLSASDIHRILSVQAAVFKRFGFNAFDLTEDVSKHYGIHGKTANRALFTLNLRIPKRLEVCKKL